MSDQGAVQTNPCSNCYLCNSEGIFIYKELKDRIFGVQGLWNLKKCINPECGLIWLDPMPNENDIYKAYSFYYTHSENKSERQSGLCAQSFMWPVRQIYSLLKRITLIRHELKRLNVMYLDKLKPGRLLEIGCGSGQRLAQIRDIGWEVEGQEIDTKAASQACSKGLKVQLGTLQDIDFPDSFFDAIIMNHVIEHVHNPIALLAECKRILRVNGILMAVTPNMESWGHRHFGKNWRGLEPPRHLHLYTQKSLKKVAARAGFDSCTLWTTAVRAKVILAGSLDIRHKGNHIMGSPLRNDIEIIAMLLQLWARAVYFFNPDSGEECILKAEKKRP